MNFDCFDLIVLTTQSSSSNALKKRIGKGRSDFLWRDEELGKVAEHVHFRHDGFGKYVLKRTHVVNEVMKAVDSQLVVAPSNSTSVYLSGCRGMGKTCDLKLLAQYLKSKGWEVYWFKSAADIPQGIGDDFLAYASENKTIKVAVLVDEVAAQPQSGLFTALLKDAPPNVLTVGAAVPRYITTGGTASFKTVLRTPTLILKESDEDVIALIEYWKGFATNTSPEMVDFVCRFLLNHCGGHVYPVLAFMEHYFTNDEAKKVLADKNAFECHFLSPEFANSDNYRSVCRRCFETLSIDQDSTATLSRVLSGGGNAADINTLSRLGWWDPDKHDVVSALLMNESLAQVQPVSPLESRMYLDQRDTPEHNLEKLIIEGLYRMKPHELTCTTNETGWPIENALSHNWVCSVKALFTNVHLEFLHPIKGSWVDMSVNGFVNGAIEALRNATKTKSHAAKPGSQDIDEHLQRFLTGAYREKKNFALLNFAMKGKIVLPRDSDYHQKVYTYDHLTNSLYRGGECIRAPAVAELPCPVSPIRVNNISGPSTWGGGIRGGVNLGGKRANYSTVVVEGPAQPTPLSARNLLAQTVTPRVVLRGMVRLFERF